ncbi:hypothetical protein M2132_002388 [Dysgonomonas sp. PH5-45]|uniref:LysM peptidoglycan-binding domain-containing protein n=1 Tax=unclassified Dysgonomonas TaxID=2630389 RepID=UPI00247523B1|nr:MULTISPECIES: hypothetical protein [unclassified Dysgonomonas]MDH6356034.1 hypothetical protein [Dysgonomonas sp. PH5-45]MDH6388925.1 hypothetical protein [Dysgonomonas sp. PH5-37]
MSNKGYSNNKQKKRVAIIGTIVILLLVFGLYKYITYEPAQAAPVQTKEGLQLISLENPDSAQFLDVIMSEQRMNIIILADKFYGNSAYWPYVFEINKESIQNPLDIPKNTVLRIPRIDSVLAEKDGLEEVKRLGDSILSEIDRKKNTTEEKLIFSDNP